MDEDKVTYKTLKRHTRVIWAYYREQGIMLRWGSNVAYEVKKFVETSTYVDLSHLQSTIETLHKCMQAEIDIQLLGIERK